jgi:ERCC4-type nuclease
MTNKSLQSILNSITVIIDTREHSDGNCANIISYLDCKGIKHISRKLEFGDYSFSVGDQSYENKIAIERKASLTELSGNLAQSRARFEAELTRAKETGAKLILMCENGSWDGIIEHKYRTDLSPKSYLASLMSFSSRYGIYIQFVQQKYAGMFIFSTFYYYLRNELKEAAVV